MTRMISGRRLMKLKNRASVIFSIYMAFCCAILPLQAWHNKSSSAHSTGTRRLVLVLDGVPYQTIAELRAEGRFKSFHDPARMISTFPSLTNPAMIEILQAEESPGYEDHYFDRDRNRLLGSIQDRLRGEKFIHGTFRETFDYHAPAFKGALGYVAAPVGAIVLAQLDLAEFRRTFRRSDSPVFVGYIGETDSLAHLGGEGPLKAFLRTVDRTVEELIAESNGRLEVELFSDHGNNYADHTAIDLNGALKRAGFETEKRLKNQRSVVLPKHGLVGSSMLFTAPENRAKVAEICSALNGVDFAVYPINESSLELVSRRGRAQVRRNGERFKYEDLGGDPLALNQLSQSLQARGVFDEGGFASDEDWWQATRSHRYVDPLRRLFDGFTKHVKSRADVIVSYEDGYLLGSPVLSIFAEMRATHGNLLRGETEGFAMSTRRKLDEAIRGSDLNQLFALNERQKARLYLSSLGGAGHCQTGPALAQMLASDKEER